MYSTYRHPAGLCGFAGLCSVALQGRHPTVTHSSLKPDRSVGPGRPALIRRNERVHGLIRAGDMWMHATELRARRLTQTRRL
jgi:hypothetical protein